VTFFGDVILMTSLK